MNKKLAIKQPGSAFSNINLLQDLYALYGANTHIHNEWL